MDMPDQFTANLRRHEAEQDRREREWECLTVAEKAAWLAASEDHYLLRKILLAYVEHESNERELGRVVSLLINDNIDEL